MLLAGLRLRLIVVLQPDAPRAFCKAGIGVLGCLGVKILAENERSYPSYNPPSTVGNAS